MKFNVILITLLSQNQFQNAFRIAGANDCNKNL